MLSIVKSASDPWVIKHISEMYQWGREEDDLMIKILNWVWKSGTAIDKLPMCP